MNNGERRSRLAASEKAFVVQRLACFDTPTEVAAAVKDEFGIEITPQAVQGYDPTKHAGRHLSAELRRLFENTRKSFLDDLEAHVPEANKAVRVGYLSHAVRAYRARGNYIQMAVMLEKVAKEMGNVHTNRREISGRHGRPLEFADMTEEQLDQRLYSLLQAMGLTFEEAGQAVDDGSDGSSEELH